jgi:hypothetical protein
MISSRLQDQLFPWVEKYSKAPLSSFGRKTMPVIIPTDPLEKPTDLLAIQVGDQRALILNDQDIEPKLKELVGNLHPDTIFSTFGFYELSRVTLPYGISVWGPNWFLFGEECTIGANIDNRVEKINDNDLSEVDYKRFWHCYPQAIAGFGIREAGEITALATVKDRESPVCEIGMEVSQGSQGKGMGRAVVTAAARWILENGQIPLAVVGPFNIPSTRTLRSSGLEYMFQCMEGKRDLFYVPPQTLGFPSPDTVMYNSYPNWAMNKDIKENPYL